LDETYDLTILKFTNLPKSIVNTIEKKKRKQIDCRNYYKPILKMMKIWKHDNPVASELEEEQKVGNILQGLVVKHFYLSRKECLRKKRPFSVRYNWEFGGKTIILWYPMEMGPTLFKEWLESKISKSDYDDSELQPRLQTEIDHEFFVGRRVDLDNKVIKNGPRTDPASHFESSTFNLNLVDIVTSEKVNNIENLRPSIRSLGNKLLAQLINRIFDDIANGVFEDKKISADFGISKSTFSRFAGSLWQERLEQGKDIVIPDLWQNTAKVIATDSEFIEAANDAGVMENIKNVLSIIKD
ncbi:MAG: hypothetical protein U9N54_07405, partial [candidate division Zixibacteria bacterium]|nr:hypothetical protein [candidate division Zixibacteria bacterium]